MSGLLFYFWGDTCHIPILFDRKRVESDSDGEEVRSVTFLRWLSPFVPRRSRIASSTIYYQLGKHPVFSACDPSPREAPNFQRQCTHNFNFLPAALGAPQKSIMTGFSRAVVLALCAMSATGFMPHSSGESGGNLGLALGVYH
jgi:hypothetical protein